VCRERGLAAIVNMHNVPLARRFCPRILGLVDGRVVFDGSPATLDDVVLERVYGAEAIEQRHGEGAAEANVDGG
jgi:phosphonate transport system ATP-binding protein